MHKPYADRDLVVAFFPTQDPVDHHVGIIGLPEAVVREKVAAGRAFFWHPDGHLSTDGIIPAFRGDDLGPERSDEEIAAIADGYGLKVALPPDPKDPALKTDEELAAHLTLLKISPFINREKGKPARPMTREEMLPLLPLAGPPDPKALREARIIAIRTERMRLEGEAWELSRLTQEERAVRKLSIRFAPVPQPAGAPEPPNPFDISTKAPSVPAVTPTPSPVPVQAPVTAPSAVVPPPAKAAPPVIIPGAPKAS